MVSAVFKSWPILGMTLAALAGASVPQDTQGMQDREETRSANAAQRGAPISLLPAPIPAAPAAAPISDPAIASAIAQWTAIRQTDALPFDTYAGFLLAHPGWPGETANRRAAERGAALADPVRALTYFRRFPPQSAVGAAAQARALLATGASAEAASAARRAWRMGTLGLTDEAFVLSVPGALTTDDHDARMDMLLWAGQTSAATRQIAYVSPSRRDVFAARLALQTKAPEAAQLATLGEQSYAGDPGFIADRATWLRNAGAGPTARTWLARIRSLTGRPGNVEKWYEVLLVNARGAAADGQWQTAYDIARQVDDAYPPGTDVSQKPYGERDDYTSLAWLAGQAALTKLGRPADAMTMFDRYGRGSMSPQTRAKGFYWAGRAAEAAGMQVEASAFFTRAAGYRDQYYGQLATEHLGRPLTPPPPVTAAIVSEAARIAFESRETVRAVRFLGYIGSHQDQTAFVRQIAADAKTDTDHLLAERLSRDIGRPDLAVMIGRSAVQNGRGDYSATGFPTVPVPAGYEGNWTLVHAIARQESQFDRAAVSSAGARGLMQLMPATAREQAGKMGISYDPAALTTDPMLSIQLGSSYFQRVYDRFGSYPLAIAAYNAGGGNVNKWIAAYGDPRTGAIDMVDWVEAIPFAETRNYVQRVLENAVVYDLMNPARARSQGQARLSWYLGRNRAG
jgi:soluble lytic murein transglycosylase